MEEVRLRLDRSMVRAHSWSQAYQYDFLGTTLLVAADYCVDVVWLRFLNYCNQRCL
jgi:hypothetical protein